MECIRQGQTGMITIVDNSAALSQLAQTVPDNKGLVLAAQDSAASSGTTNYVVIAASVAVILGALIAFFILRSKRRRYRAR